MKRADVAMIILIASMSVMVSFAIVNSLPFFQISDKDITVPYVDEITPDIEEPSELVFNDQAINPTVQAIIGAGAAE